MCPTSICTLTFSHHFIPHHSEHSWYHLPHPTSPTWQELLQAASNAKEALKHSEMVHLLCKFHLLAHNPWLVIQSIWFHLWYLKIMSCSQKVPMDIDTWKMQENILYAWQTPVSIRGLIGWLQFRGCRFKSWIFSSFTFFSNMLSAVKFKG